MVAGLASSRHKLAGGSRRRGNRLLQQGKDGFCNYRHPGASPTRPRPVWTIQAAPAFGLVGGKLRAEGQLRAPASVARARLSGIFTSPEKWLKGSGLAGVSCSTVSPVPLSQMQLVQVLDKG